MEDNENKDKLSSKKYFLHFQQYTKLCTEHLNMTGLKVHHV